MPEAPPGAPLQTGVPTRLEPLTACLFEAADFLRNR